jgi:integrase/recombinase XerD
MDGQEVQWEYYPFVAQHSATRAFVERLSLKGKRPKTIDAYARAIEDLLVYFNTTDIMRVIEADEGDLDSYIAHLKQRGPKKRGQGGVTEDHSKIRYLTGRKLSDNTIAQRVVACRLFYDFLIGKRLRSDPINPIARGNSGRDGQHPVRGPVSPRKRLPWVPSDDVWEYFVRHVLLHEAPRTRVMILLAYDAALRREELMSLRVDDLDWARGVITVRPETTKGGRMRYVPVSAATLHLVRDYLEGDRRALIAAYDGEDLGPIFLSESTRNPGRPLAVGAFDEVIEQVREKVGLPALTPHTLRHQRCTMLKRAGVSLDDIALFAGH